MLPSPGSAQWRAVLLLPQLLLPETVTYLPDTSSCGMGTRGYQAQQICSPPFLPSPTLQGALDPIHPGNIMLGTHPPTFSGSS